MRVLNWTGVLLATLPALGGCGSDRADSGERKAEQTQTAPAPSRTDQLLQADAAVQQIQAPLQPMGIHLAGLHVLKDDTRHQMEAHHFCAQVNADFAQCVIFDSDTTQANLIGVEYIISERRFDALPEAERPLWHPHNYEILSGLLVAPELPEAAEKTLMRGKLNSYGKTWHLWDAGNSTAAPQELPLGQPKLAWSFNRDGEADPALGRQLAEHTRIDLVARARARSDLTAEARPQAGVDALKDSFSGDTQPLAGVVDREAAQDEGATADSQENPSK